MEFSYEYIDRVELEEYFGEEFDFSLLDDNDWIEIDSLVGEECEKWGIVPSIENEEYIEICRDCINEIIDGK